jgi:transcriptional regulator with XRE-family HTH domain
MREAALFGRLVRATRKAHRWRLGQLAEKAGTGVKHLGRIERGEKQPSFELIIALAKALSVSPAVFFQFDDLEANPNSIKGKIRHLIDKQDTEQLVKAHRILKAALNP